MSGMHGFCVGVALGFLLGVVGALIGRRNVLAALPLLATSIPLFSQEAKPHRADPGDTQRTP